mmetsp:Transcript_43449/g.86230  ORF Transcript_43449/g.86230 Transcript_43449/m.86230 type:complete len:209 (+) Transcript_43449:62-688(+)
MPMTMAQAGRRLEETARAAALACHAAAGLHQSGKCAEGARLLRLAEALARQAVAVTSSRSTAAEQAASGRGEASTAAIGTAEPPRVSRQARKRRNKKEKEKGKTQQVQPGCEDADMGGPVEAPLALAIQDADETPPLQGTATARGLAGGTACGACTALLKRLADISSGLDAFISTVSDPNIRLMIVALKHVADGDRPGTSGWQAATVR